MKIFLRLIGGPSAVSNQPSEPHSFLRVIGKLIPKIYQPSVVSNQQSELSCQLSAKSWVLPKDQLSAVSYQQSASGSWSSAKFWLISKTYYLTPKDQLSALNSSLRVVSKLLPYTYYLTPFILLVFFVSCSAALAQEFDVHAAPAALAVSETNALGRDQPEITPLKIGDRIPDELWEMHFPVVSGKSDHVQYLSLGDFKDKLIILDFWATWCAPCISSLHKLDTLQKQFKDDLIVIPTSYEQESKVIPFLNEKGIELPSLIEEKELKKYFPHRSIPHQIIIDKSKVVAITGANEINSGRLTKLLSGEAQQFKYKKEIDVDRFQSIIPYIDPEVKRKDFQSVLTGYIDGLSGSGFQKNEDLQTQYVFNKTIAFLYSTILKIFPNEIELDVEDKEWYYRQKRDGYENIFCFQSIVPSYASERQMKSIALNNLNDYFNLNGRFEKRVKECFIIKDKNTKSKQVRPDTLGKMEFPFKTTLGLLNFSLNWSPNTSRFLNESSYQGTFWAENPNALSNLRSDITKLNEFLGDYNLHVIKETRTVDVFVISENRD